MFLLFYYSTFTFYLQHSWVTTYYRILFFYVWRELCHSRKCFDLCSRTLTSLRLIMSTKKKNCVFCRAQHLHLRGGLRFGQKGWTKRGIVVGSRSVLLGCCSPEHSMVSHNTVSFLLEVPDYACKVREVFVCVFSFFIVVAFLFILKLLLVQLSASPTKDFQFPDEPFVLSTSAVCSLLL